VPFKILTTTIIELGTSTSNPIVATFLCQGIRRKGFLVAMSSAFTCQAARNNMPGFLVAGFLNKTALRQGDIFSDNVDLTEANKNYGINLISQATLNLRVPTRVIIDISKIQIPTIALSTYTIELEEGFFRQRSVTSTNDLLTNINNQMPTLANAPLVTLLTNSRPLWFILSPPNGTTTYINTKISLRIRNTNSTGSSGSDISNVIIPGSGFIRLYREGVLVSTLSCFSNKVTFTNNTIEVDYTGLLDANKNFYILIDNGFAVDRDGFATQPVTSNSQCSFITFPSTDTEFPDLISLQVAAANLLLPDSLILVRATANITSQSTMITNGERAKPATGISTTTATMTINTTYTMGRFASLEMSAATMNIVPNYIYASEIINMASTATLAMPFGRTRPANASITTTSGMVANVRKITNTSANPTMMFGMSGTGISNLPITLEIDTNLISGNEFNFYGNVDVNQGYWKVLWGDGTTEYFGNNIYGATPSNEVYPNTGLTPNNGSGAARHTYAAKGVYQIRIIPLRADNQLPTTCSAIYIGNWQNETQTNSDYFFRTTFSKNALTKIISFGDIYGITNVSTISGYSFAKCRNLQQAPAYLPPAITSLKYMFEGCRLFNDSNVSNWNTGNVTNMLGTFSDAWAFNQPLNSWNTSNVTNMSAMFYYTRAFNQPLNSWNTSNVTNMMGMFEGFPGNGQAFPAIPTPFNQPIGDWNTANVTNMSSMFSSSQFNQPLTRVGSKWNTANVTQTSYSYNQAGMTQMFANNNAFNQNLSSWCVTNITQEPYAFRSFGVWTQPKPAWGTCP
jgi:surface protein